MQIKHQFDFQVLPQEVDGAQHLRLVALESYLLNVAGFAADANGFGSLGMMEEGVTWVLSRLALEMDRMPAQYEHFKVETWVEDYGRLLTTRNLRILSADGEVLGRAVSQWAFIDLKSRRPVSLQTHADLARFANGEAVGIEKPQKVSAVSAESAAVSHHRVSYSDIDYNGHTNSMKYLEWALDTLPCDKLYNQRVKRLDINYLKESVLGEDVRLLTQLDGEQATIEIQDASGVAHARISVVFEA